jgi:hypothetical protein
MPKLDNEYYAKVTPLRLTEQQDKIIRAKAEKLGVSVQHLLRDTLVASGLIPEGPAQKTRAGYERIATE